MTTNTRKQKMDEAAEMLADGIEKLTNSEDWKKYLDTQAKFHRYSFFNTMMILMQKPDATRVTGYGNKAGTSGWLSLGRQVRKGEKAIKIYAPMFRNVENDQTGEKELALVGFKLVNVFDISQTDGDPLPTGEQFYTKVTDGAPEDHTPAIALAVADQWQIEYRSLDSNAKGGPHGWTDFHAKLIVIDADMTPAEKFTTLIHEVAHKLLHDPNGDGRPSCRGDVELEAESVQYIVSKAMGLETGSYSFAYVAGWAGADVQDKMKKHGQRIAKAAKTILEAFETKGDG